MPLPGILSLFFNILLVCLNVSSSTIRLALLFRTIEDSGTEHLPKLLAHSLDLVVPGAFYSMLQTRRRHRP
jgi:hypothetical protein